VRQKPLKIADPIGAEADRNKNCGVDTMSIRRAPPRSAALELEDDADADANDNQQGADSPQAIGAGSNASGGEERRGWRVDGHRGVVSVRAGEK